MNEGHVSTPHCYMTQCFMPRPLQKITQHSNPRKQQLRW